MWGVGNLAKTRIEKSPMQTAKNNIKTAAILAFISAALTGVVAYAAGNNLFGVDPTYAFIDVGLMVVLAILLLTIKSRIAAVVLLLYFLYSKYLQFTMDPSQIVAGAPMAIIWIVGYVLGVVGTFKYHKLKSEEAAPVPSQNTDTDTSDYSQFK